MLKLGLFQPPSIKEAISLADVLDSLGERETADLIDDYIKRVASTDDIVKQAGFWKNVWGRMKGKLKVWFIEEYKELYLSAKEVERQIEDRIANLIEEKKKLRQDFKNYELGTWRRRIEDMKGLNAEDILEPFDRAYGRFLKYVIKFEDKKEEEKDISKMKPSERLVEPIERSERETAGELSKIRWQTPYAKEAIQMSADKNIVRIQRDKIDRYFRYMSPIAPKQMKIKEKTPLKVMSDIFGDNNWEEFFEDKGYIYYRKMEKVEEKKEEAKKEEKKEEKLPEVKETETVPVAKEEEGFIDPVLPGEKFKAKKPVWKKEDIFEEEPIPLTKKKVKPEEKKEEGPKEKVPDYYEEFKAPAKETPKAKGGRKVKPMVAGEKPAGEAEIWVEVNSGPELVTTKKRKGEDAHLFKIMKKKSVKSNQTIIEDTDLISKLNTTKKPGVGKVVLIIPSEGQPKEASRIERILSLMKLGE